MNKRSYQQDCALAIALDLVGERWALLIVRELLIEPRRYRDLLENLPGIGTNLLAVRLEWLSRLGLVEKAPPGRPQSPYQLTETGCSLQPVVEALVRFGMQFPEYRQPGYARRSEWNLHPLKMYFDASCADWGGSYELRLDDDVYTLSKEEDGLKVREGEAAEAVAGIRMSSATAAAIASGRASPQDAIREGQVQARGPADSVEAFFRAFRAGG